MRTKYIQYFSLLTIFIISFTIVISSVFPREKYITVNYNQLTVDAKQQVECLAQNIYYEAGHEPETGQVAVALVTLNRVKDGRFADDICSVVKQKTRVAHIGDRYVVCQFSWFCETRKPIKQEVYDRVMRVALYVYANYEMINDVTHGALYYHADYVNPRWKLTKTVTIGRHIFYKEKVGT